MKIRKYRCMECNSEDISYRAMIRQSTERISDPETNMCYCFNCKAFQPKAFSKLQTQNSIFMELEIENTKEVKEEQIPPRRTL